MLTIAKQVWGIDKRKFEKDIGRKAVWHTCMDSLRMMWKSGSGKKREWKG